MREKLQKDMLTLQLACTRAHSQTSVTDGRMQGGCMPSLLGQLLQAGRC